jgi:hypothetical protein
VFGIAAVVAFILAYVFKGTGSDPAAWCEWQALSILGLLFLALAGLGVGPAVPVVVHRRAAGE